MMFGYNIFSGDIGPAVRREYGFLIRTGRTDEEVEQMLFGYFLPKLDDTQETEFWTSLAYCACKRDRLTPAIRENTMNILDKGGDLDQFQGNDRIKREKVLQNLRDRIHSAVYAPKKVQPYRPVACPWEKDSLLTYPVCHNPKFQDSPFWNRRVLLRVANVKRIPESHIVPQEVFIDDMVVCLCDWYGEDIQNPEWAKMLPIIPFAEEPPLLPPNARLLGMAEGKMGDIGTEIYRRMTTGATLYGVSLNLYGGQRILKKELHYVGKATGPVPDLAKALQHIAGPYGFDSYVIRALEKYGTKRE